MEEEEETGRRSRKRKRRKKTEEEEEEEERRGEREKHRAVVVCAALPRPRPPKVLSNRAATTPSITRARVSGRQLDHRTTAGGNAAPTRRPSYHRSTSYRQQGTSVAVQRLRHLCSLPRRRKRMPVCIHRMHCRLAWCFRLGNRASRVTVQTNARLPQLLWLDLPWLVSK